MNKKKRQKPEEFIGWKSQDNKLEVIGIAGKDKWKTVLFKVTCTECSKDIELFPDGYFISTKTNLIKGKKPCGCSVYKWKDWQFLLLASRVGEKKCFVVHGFAEKFKGIKTKLDLECLKDGYKWTTSISHVIHTGRGCPKCAGNARPTEQEVLQKCIDACKYMDYDAIGFPDGYKNAYSRFEYVCKIHGKQNVSYNNFVNRRQHCGGCARDESILYGYYPERSDEIDYLYILNFNDKFIKVGRSFDVNERIKGLKHQSSIKKIYPIRVFTATPRNL